jgi:hypothetical protein
MRLIFLYGLPATGKHTVAQYLAALTGYKLFHNHLAVDLLLSVFDFGTQPFVNATVDFIELTCPLPELHQRLDNPSRQRFQKLTSTALFDQLHADGVFDATHMPAPRVTVDTSLHTPEAAAAAIARGLAIPPSS